MNIIKQTGISEGIEFTPEVRHSLMKQNDFQQTLMEQLAIDAAKKEETILLTVLSNYLKRPATLEDAKDCEMVTTPETPRFCYFFCHKGVKLGYMEKSDFKFTNENGTDFAENKYRMYQEMRFIPTNNEAKELLLIFKNKGCCEYTWNRAESCLHSLKNLIAEQDHYTLRLALEHVKQGEGNEAFHHEVDQIIKKYK